jgi:hypothetical protein
MMVAIPYIMVPPLPSKNTSTSPKKIEKRQRFYQRFLHAIHKSEILKTSQIFIDFLEMPDRDDWCRAVKKSQQMKIFNVIQDDG